MTVQGGRLRPGAPSLPRLGGVRSVVAKGRALVAALGGHEARARSGSLPPAAVTAPRDPRSSSPETVGPRAAPDPPCARDIDGEAGWILPSSSRPGSVRSAKTGEKADRNADY